MKKYELLDREAKELLKTLNKELSEDKENLQRLSEQRKKCEEFYMSQAGAITGAGGFAFLLELIKFSQQRNVLENYIEKKDMSEELKEFLLIQKERYNLVEKAKKEGLNLDISPEEDLKSFLKGEKGFAPENFRRYFKEQENAEKYGYLTAKVINTFNKFEEVSFFKLDKKFEIKKDKGVDNAKLWRI